MSKIVFFNIPAHGHTNPTIEVARTLTQRGHTVRYHSFDMFREKLEAAGAQFVSCDAYLPPAPEDFERRAKYDFASLISMVTHVTLEMEAAVCPELEEFEPDCIVADSMCVWGKLYAKKLGIPMVCSTTSFAFNEHTAKMMKPGFRETCYMLTGMPRINKNIQALRQRGYDVENLVQLIQNDNDTDTIVYTSRAFQPMSETFGDKYAFIGPSVPHISPAPLKKGQPLVYISLGTVLSNVKFCQSCIEALKELPCYVVMSVGEEKNIGLLREIPSNFQVKAQVPQLEVLQSADVFVTHCGMNSVNESIFFDVPMVLFPQHSEQGAVARRAQEVGAGLLLKKGTPKAIRDAVTQVMRDKDRYQENIKVIAESFRSAGGAKSAAEMIEKVIELRRRPG